MFLEEKRNVGRETRKSHMFRIHSGFYERYCNGYGVELGHQGYEKGKVLQTIVENARPIGLNTPGYDGISLPENSVPTGGYDFIFSSHVLEHIDDWQEAIRNWHKNIKIGGHMIIIVPHQFLYEKKRRKPSNYNPDHKRFYTPASLLLEIESALIPNSYRIVHMRDWDVGYDYTIGPMTHAVGAHEIECVVKKIQTPEWGLTE